MYDDQKSPEAPKDITSCLGKGTGIYPLGFYGQRQKVPERLSPVQYGDTKLLMQLGNEDCLQNCMYKAFVLADQYEVGQTFCSNPEVVLAYMEKNKISLPATTVKPRQEAIVQPAILPPEFRYKPKGLEGVTERALGFLRNYVATPISKLVRN